MIRVNMGKGSAALARPLSPLIKLTWIIHESRLADCHAPLATTILFK